jgi:large subunit ribosomal protein L25
MDKLVGTIREPNAKAKLLRKQGVIPGVLYGKSLDESISLQFPLREVEHFLKRNTIGYKVEVEIEGKKHLALLKELTFTPAVNKIEHLSFQALTKGERVNSTAQIFLKNQEKISETIQQTLFEIPYKALVEDLFTHVEVDMEGMEVGDHVLVSQLNIPKKEGLEVLVPEDTMVVAVVEKTKMDVDLDVEETTEDEPVVVGSESDAASEDKEDKE